MKRLIWSLALSFLLLTGVRAATSARIVTGDERTEQYLPLLNGQKVALFSNRTGMAAEKHVLDVLLEHGVNVTCIFSPEHGFRGLADAGEKVQSSVDEKTGVPILSLYGGTSPLNDPQTMDRFDILVVDIQDVGLRFYTYYVTMCHLMDACAAANKAVIVLDRPNPNGHYVDGPVLDMTLRSGVGWLPIPVVHGMTLGELAQMINGEGWLEQHRKCHLTVIPCLNYTHQSKVVISVPPSPNLPNRQAILLYPSLCYFEATPVSVGRGTKKPFQIFGSPAMKGFPYSFTPKSRPGATNPPQKDKRCYGRDLSRLPENVILQRGIDLSYLIEAYHSVNIGDDFFTNFFEKLIGNKDVRKMIEQGKSAEEIRATWQDDVEKFKQERRPYLLYPE
jgi:uncharacterized protein YbbC (DUF1343 family)